MTTQQQASATPQEFHNGARVVVIDYPEDSPHRAKVIGQAGTVISTPHHHGLYYRVVFDSGYLPPYNSVRDSWLLREDELGWLTSQGTILHEAIDITSGQRNQDYGPPEEDLARAAQHWSAILGVEVTARQVALCMIGIKLARLYQTPDHRDSIVDIPGWARCYALVVGVDKA